MIRRPRAIRALLLLALALGLAAPAAAQTTTPAKEKVKAKSREKAKAKPAEAVKEAAPAEKVDLNAATAEQLETLPGIGPAFSREIIAARPFRSVDDLEKIKGLSKARIDALRDRVTVTPIAPAAAAPTPKAAASPSLKKATATTAEPAPKAKPATKAATAATPARPVNLNTASLQELDALPGIGPVKAQAILDYRKTQPFKTREDVMKVRGIKEGEFAKIRDLIVAP